jgi:WD40 repeat protein
MNLALSPDGETGYSTSLDQTVRVWNIATGEQLAAYQPFNDGFPNGLAVSPDGKQLLVGRDWLEYDPYGIQDGFIALLDTSTGETLSKLEGHTSVVEAITFSPDGRYALSGSRDQTVRLWDVSTGEQLAIFTGHTSEIWQVAFNPDGLTGYSTGLDGSLRVWDLREYLDGD